MASGKKAGRLLASVAAGSLLIGPVLAQVAPSGGVLYLDSSTPFTPNTYTQYSTTVTAATTGLSYALFAFREQPAYFYFDDASITAVGSNVNLLTNPGFEGGSTQSTLSSNVRVPTGWGTIYQTGTVPSAPGTVSSRYGANSGSYVWYDGSVETYDGIYQTINTVAGQQYLISFYLKGDRAFSTPTIEMATYFGACGTGNGSCATSFGNGFVISQPAAPTIDTAGGDIAADRFSLASPAATGSALQFQGGTLVMQGGGFAGNIVSAPVTLTAANGTVDTGPGSGGFSGVVSGPGSLTVTGGNTFALTGANTYAGGTQLQSGTLVVGNDSALGTGPLAMADGTTLKETTGATLGNAAILSGTAGFQTSDTVGDGDGLIYDGVISGTGTLLKTGASGLRLTAANTYAGGTIIAAGHIAISDDDALGTGTLTFAGGSLRPHVDGLTVGNAAVLSADGTIATRGHDLTYAGAISGAGRLIKTGQATLTLTNANSYTGGTALNAGTLAVGNAAALGTGPLTVNAGVLQAAADGLTIANGVTLAGDGTVDSQGGTLTLSGLVAGSGQLTKTGSGTLALSGTSTYTGATTVAAGTLQAGSTAGLSPSSAVTIAGGATLDLGGFASEVASLAGAGTVTNTGSGTATLTTGRSGVSSSFGGVLADGTAPLGLVKAGSGTLTLSGPSTYSGGTEVLAGTLEVGNSAALGTGPVGLDDGTQLRFVADGLTLANALDLRNTDPTIDTGSGFETISGAITGPGQLTKIGIGTLDLTGTSPYTGATEVAGGTLLVDGALVASTVTVDAGATLGGRGSVAGVVVGSGGRLAPSASQALAITGNLRLLTGSTYEVTVNADGTNGKLAVAGGVDLGGAALSVLAGSGTFRARSYTLLTAGTLLPGTTFGTVTTATSLALLRPQVTYDYAANDVTLTLNPIEFRTIAATANQAGVAGAIQDLGPGNRLYDAVAGLDVAGARQAFNAASGVTHANTQSAITSSARTGATLLLDRLWDVSGSGLSAQQVLDQFAPDRLPALVRCYGPTPDPVRAAPPPTYTAWGEAFGTFGHTDARPNAGPLDRSLGGFILGIDTPLDRIGGDKWRAGVAGGYTSTSFKSPLDGGSGTVQNVFGSLYGGARYGAVDLRLGTMAGGTFVDARRDVAFGGVPLFNEIERSHNAGYTVQTFGEVGYRIPAGAVVLEPIAGAAYLHSHQDGFTEKGGVAALTVSAQDTDLGTTTLGVRAEAQPFKDLPIVAHALLGWQHAIGDVSPATTLAFASAPLDTFSVTGAPIDRDALAAEAALDYRVSALLDVGLTYVGQVGATAADHSVKGRIEYRF